MRTLLVTPFAPYRDGIATYAVQELRRLRADGDLVEVLSPLPSAARHHLPLGGPAGLARLHRLIGRFDRTIVQFGPELLFGGCRTPAERVAVWLALASLARRTSLDLRIHEVEYGPLERNPAERRAAKVALATADRVTVHTEAERARLDELVGLGRRVEIVAHGRDFAAAARTTRAEARRDLDLPVDRFLFVAIGFLQHHKGFDRAVEAMGRLGGSGVELHVVGSARVDAPDITGYVESLAAQCARVAGATLHQRYVSDAEFDRWIQAADAVVLPYREIWSSGVVERARLFETPILAADLPQLRDQAPDGTVFAADDDELLAAMRRLSAAGRLAAEGMLEEAAIDLSEPAGGAIPGATDDTHGADADAASAAAPRPWDVDRGDPNRGAVQAQIVARAREGQLEEARSASLDRGADRRPVDPLLALGHLHRPQPTSARPGVAPVKRLVDRLIGWRLDPLAERIEALQRATVEAMSDLDRRVPAGGVDPEPDDRSGGARPGEPAERVEQVGAGGAGGVERSEPMQVTAAETRAGPVAPAGPLRTGEPRR